jgi:hypothetical protein
MLSRNVLIIASAAMIVALASTWGWYRTQSSLLRQRAKQLLENSLSIQVGRSSFAEVEQLGRRIHAKANGECTPVSCQLRAAVTNEALPRMWRKSLTLFSVTLVVKNGLLAERNYSYIVDSATKQSFVTLSEARHEGKEGAVDPRQYPIVNRQWGGGVEKWRLWVAIGPNSSEKERMSFLDFDFRCLSRYHGCRDAQELLPSYDWGKPPVTN